MPGKPFQSKLAEHTDAIRDMRGQKLSYRAIADTLNSRYGLGVTHNAIYSFVHAKNRKRLFKKRFTDGLDRDIRDGLLKQIVAVWTHDSTAIEGNTLTLGETAQVLEVGLTISGKPLRDHQEVYGHARAIDLLNTLLDTDSVTEQDIFDLHTAVMPQSPIDSLRPIGAWKRDYNGTTGVKDGKMIYREYAAPFHVPALMAEWLAEFNRRLDAVLDEESACNLYCWTHTALVRIHPFFDGNGRIARLLANLPVLRGGHPPIVISSARRADYITLLWDYQLDLDTLVPGMPLVPANETLSRFVAFLRDQCSTVNEMIAQARALQATRSQQ